jgi:hypothetical protein
VKLVSRLRLPLVVIGPPIRPVPLPTLVTVPPDAVFVRVTVPPNATVPPPDNPEPAFTVMEEFASIAFVTPADGILIVPLVVIGPPFRPAPVLTVVTVPFPPPPPGKVCPGAKVRRPLLAIENPVSAGEVPFDPNSRFNEPEGFDESFAAGSAIQRKSCVTADEVVLLKLDASTSSGLELKPCDAVAVPVCGKVSPTDVTGPLNVPVDAASPPVKAAVVPVRDPLRMPPVSCR